MLMEKYGVKPSLILFTDKLLKLLGCRHKIEIKTGSVVMIFYRGIIFKKELVKISQTEKLVGIDIYLDNLSESQASKISHLLSHLESLLKKRDVQLVFNKIII